MEVQITTKPAFSVLGILDRGSPPSIPELWKRFKKRSGEIQKKSGGAYGVMDHCDETIGEFSYLAGFEVEAGTEAPEGMTTWEVPEQTYAVVTCTVPTVDEAIRFFYKEWLPKHDCRHAGPEFEYYPEEWDEKAPMYFYFPVRKA